MNCFSQLENGIFATEKDIQELKNKNDRGFVGLRQGKRPHRLRTGAADRLIATGDNEDDRACPPLW